MQVTKPSEIPETSDRQLLSYPLREEEAVNERPFTARKMVIAVRLHLCTDAYILRICSILQSESSRDCIVVWVYLDWDSASVSFSARVFSGDCKDCAVRLTGAVESVQTRTGEL